MLEYIVFEWKIKWKSVIRFFSKNKHLTLNNSFWNRFLIKTEALKTFLNYALSSKTLQMKKKREKYSDWKIKYSFFSIQ